MLQRQEVRSVQYDSRDEAKCAAVLAHFLDWKPELGRTYQRPITHRHDADFYLPEQNLVVEFHPPVIKWYGAPGTFNRLNRLRRSLRQGEFQEVQELLCAQITHEYYKRRRALMDQSPLDGVAKMRLVVCEDASQIYQHVVKPYANESIRWEKFLRVWEA